jgi:hypothetical protein
MPNRFLARSRAAGPGPSARHNSDDLVARFARLLPCSRSTRRSSRRHGRLLLVEAVAESRPRV